MLVISHISGNTTHAISLHVILNSKSQPIIISKKLVQKLGLTPKILEPYFYTIITSVEGIDQATH